MGEASSCDSGEVYKGKRGMKESKQLPPGREFLCPGPARLLCVSASSPEYESFLAKFCNAHRYQTPQQPHDPPHAYLSARV